MQDVLIVLHFALQRCLCWSWSGSVLLILPVVGFVAAPCSTLLWSWSWTLHLVWLWCFNFLQPLYSEKLHLHVVVWPTAPCTGGAFSCGENTVLALEQLALLRGVYMLHSDLQLLLMCAWVHGFQSCFNMQLNTDGLYTFPMYTGFNLLGGWGEASPPNTQASPPKPFSQLQLK